MIINSVGGGGGGVAGVPKCRHIPLSDTLTTSSNIGVTASLLIYTPGTYYIFASYIVQRGNTRVTQMATAFPKSAYVEDTMETDVELTMLATNGQDYYPAIKAKVKNPATITSASLKIPTYTVATGSTNKYVLYDIYVMTFDGEVSNITTSILRNS